MMKKKLRATAAMLIKGTKTTLMKLKRVEKNARNLFVVVVVVVCFFFFTVLIIC